MRILILCGASYELGWGRSQNLARELALQGNDVFYLNEISPLISKDTLSKRHPVSSKEGVSLFYQFGLPSVRIPFLKPADRKLLTKQLTKIIDTIQNVDVLIYYGVPAPWMTEYISGRLDHTLSIYDCADDKKATFTDLQSKAHGIAVEKWEQHLISHVDFSVGMSESVCSQLKEKSKKPVYRIENGVDLKLFTELNTCNKSRTKTHRVVYAGAINGRTDIDRLKMFAEKSNVVIDLYGNSHPVLNAISKCRNITYKGLVSYYSLPQILAKYEYGLLPYKNIESIRNSSPLKVLQYLASGLKVISFPFPVWPDLSSFVQIIENTLSDDDVSETLSSSNMLRSYSWSERVHSYTRILKTWGVA